MRSLRILTLAFAAMMLIASCKEDSARKHGKAQAVTHIQVGTPDDALTVLEDGNKRFVGDSMINNADYKGQQEETKDDQHPHTVVLSCMDSRIPPEIIFDQRFGDLFVNRVAGNIEDSNVIGSIEYAVKVKGTKLILVMGHSHCAAIKGAIDNVQMGNLTQLLDKIKPAITGDTTNREAMLEATAKNNVKLTMQRILQRSDIIAQLVKDNKVKIAGAYYDLATGKVEFLQ